MCLCLLWKSGHKSSEHELVIGTPKCRMILSRKKLCFNCTGLLNTVPLTAVVIITRANCKGKHRTSICEKMPKVLLTTNDYHVTYHLAIIDIEGIRGGASYASSTLIDRRNKKTIRKQCKSTETMSYASKLIPVYSVEIRDSDSVLRDSVPD